MATQSNPVFDRSDRLFQKTEIWKKSGGFKHKKPCKDWLAGKNCSHYAKARYKHFKQEIDSILQGICL